ncbi:hypothetical protein ACEUAI_13450 [Aeromonas veronii]|nr:hypothetical protein [Aeromonas veronii]
MDLFIYLCIACFFIAYIWRKNAIAVVFFSTLGVTALTLSCYFGVLASYPFTELRYGLIPGAAICWLGIFVLVKRHFKDQHADSDINSPK